MILNKPMSHVESDLRHCLKLENRYTLSKCFGTNQAVYYGRSRNEDTVPLWGGDANGTVI